MDFKTHFGKLGADQNWVRAYLDFVASAKSPIKRSHHILPRAMFSEFESFKDHAWNCKRLTPSDHFVAHYYLYRALPEHPVAYLSFLKMASVERLGVLIRKNYNETLVREMSLEYERIRTGAASIEGWLHVYKGKLHTVVSATQLGTRLASGWTQTAPPRQWVYKGDESCRIPVEKVQAYLHRGFQLGRPFHHTKEFRVQVGQRSEKHHQAEKIKPDAYAYLPHGEQHHRKEGCPPEVATKISKTLTGRKLTEQHAAKVRVAAKGKRWKWSEEAKQKLEDSGARAGTNNPWYGTKGPMGGKTHSKETRRRMSVSHKARNANNTGNSSI